nr:MAG TPA: hypothetical protein [Caudoviricetes sp.]
MRKDIEIHIGTGDITLPSKNNYQLRDFQWVQNPTGLSRYIYGEIIVPSNLSANTLYNKGVYTAIPYTPIYKEFMVRIKRLYENGLYEYLQNPADGTEWFVVKCNLYGTKGCKNVYASQLKMIADNDYYFQFDKGTMNVYSAMESDLNIVKANRQNSNMLLACVPTNNYRYPISGVGLIRWMNGNMDYTALADTIKSEFTDDGVVVNSASFDYDTHQLSLDAIPAEE